MEFLTPQLQSPTSPTNSYNNDNGTVTPGNNNNISKRSSPAEIENGTYFGMYTIPEAERIKAKQKHLNSKYSICRCFFIVLKCVRQFSYD